MPAIRTSSPSAEPWTLDQVKIHLKVDHADEDLLIGALLTAARENAEERLGRTLCTTSWRLTLDSFPSAIRLPMPPALAVAALKYIDPDGVQRTLDPADYLLDEVSEPGFVVPGYGKAWPATQARVNALQVEYTAGYGATADKIPMPIRQWILLAVSDLYRNRGLSSEVKTVPHDFAASLLDYYKIWSI